MVCHSDCDICAMGMSSISSMMGVSIRILVTRRRRGDNQQWRCYVKSFWKHIKSFIAIAVTFSQYGRTLDGCSVGGGGVSACWTGWEPVIPPRQLCCVLRWVYRPATTGYVWHSIVAAQPSRGGKQSSLQSCSYTELLTVLSPYCKAPKLYSKHSRISRDEWC